MSLSIERSGANSFVTVLALHSHEECCADVTADEGRMETCVQRYRTVGARRRLVHRESDVRGVRKYATSRSDWIVTEADITMTRVYETEESHCIRDVKPFLKR